MATTLTVLHPKGGVGRSTTVYMLGAELALRGHRVALIDRDQGQHLSRVFDFYPPAIERLVLGEDPSAALRIVDTAPEVNADRAIGYLREADWVLVPVKGPEAGSVLALPLLLSWLEQARGAQLLGFVPTMYKARRGESRQWLGELERLAARRVRRCSRPSATWPAWRRSGWMPTPMRSSLQPSRRFCLARSSRAPISFEAATAVAQARGAIQDRLAHSLPVAAIQPSPRNPRQKVDGIAELADSLRTHGLLQPVVVRRRGAGYELIAGHRRLEAARVLGWTEIAAVVRDETDDQAYILTLVENLQREDLTADEEAEALGALVRERKWSVRKVAEAIKRDHLYVSRRLRVFEDPVLRQPVLEQRMPVSTAEVLLRVPPEERAALVDEALANDWGQMDVRRALRDRRAAAPRQTRQWGVTPHPDRSTYLVNLLAEVRAVLEAGVADLSPKARRDLQATYQRLALLVTG